jgi:hypothetical protein
MTRCRNPWLPGALLCIAIGSLAFVATLTLDPRFLDPATGNDIWFEGDLGRIADEMTHRWAAHSRATVHPLFALLTVPITYAARFAGMSPGGAVAAVVGLSAAVWAAACYCLMRALALGTIDAVLFVLLSASSAAGQFWLTVPETAALGSASVMAALAVAARFTNPARQQVRKWPPAPSGMAAEIRLAAAAAASLAITVTNFMAGIVAAIGALPPRRAVQVLINAFAIVVLLWVVQRIVTPHADFFIGYSNEERYLLRPEAGGPLRAIRTIVVSGMLMPALATVEKPRRGWILSIQDSGTRTQSVLWMSGTILWLLMLGWGLAALLRNRSKQSACWPLLAVVAWFLALYAVYGTESFLYALNVVPLLVAVAAAGVTVDSGAWVVRAAVVALLTITAVNNATRLIEARDYFTPAVAANIASMFAPTSVPSSAAYL